MSKDEDLLDEVIEVGFDFVADRFRSILKKASTAEAPSLEEGQTGVPCAAACGRRTGFVCVWCRRPYCKDDAEFVSERGYCICIGCFQFMWTAGQRVSRALSAKARGQTRAGPQEETEEKPGKLRRPPWELLGVEKNASEVEVKKAYRKLVLEFHPDVQPEDKKVAANRIMDELTRAKEAMLSAARRRAAR